jgi:hypothetical protein
MQVSVRAVGCIEPACRLTGITQVTSIDGEATFTSLAITLAATGYYLTFTVDRYCAKFACIGGWSLWTKSVTFDVLVGKFARLTIRQPPSLPGVEGRDLVPNIQLSATDAGGNFVTRRSFDVYAYKGGRGFGDLLSRNDLLFRTAVNGLVSFEGLFFDIPSVYDIIFNATVENVTASVTLENLFITGKEHHAVQDAFSQPSVGQVAYQPIFPQPDIRLRDLFEQIVAGSTYAVTADMAAAQVAQGVQVVGSSVVPVVRGIARFTNIAVAGAGKGFSIVFSTQGGVSSVASNLFDVAPGLAAAVGIVTEPPSVTEAGKVLQPFPAAVLLDVGRNVVQKSAPLEISLLVDQTAPFQKIGSQAPRIAGPLIVDTVNGTAVFAGLCIQVSGTYRLKVSSFNLAATSNAFNIVPGYPTGLYMQTEPGSGMSGFELKPFPVVAFQDAYGNFVATVPKTPAVKASLLNNAGDSTLLCGGRFPCVRTLAAGRVHFDGLGVNNVGRGYTLEFETILAVQDTGQDQLLRVQSRQFHVSGIASAALVTEQPQNGQCAESIPGLTSVALQDSFGNLAPAALDLVTVTILPVVHEIHEPVIQGILQVQTTDGVAHFSDLRVDRVGEYVLRFSFGLMDKLVESQTFVVSAGEPRMMKFSVLPPTVTAGIAFYPRLVVTDACNNAAIDYTSYVIVELRSSSPPQLAIERGAYLLSAPTKILGTGTLNMTIDIKGSNYQLLVHATFPDFPRLSSLSLLSEKFTVALGDLHHLQLNGLSTSCVAMEVLIPPARVTARDLGNNVVESFVGVVRARRLTGKTLTSLLDGEIYIQAQKGLALFNNLKISEKDSAFVIEFEYSKDFNTPNENMIRVESSKIEITGTVNTLRVYKAIAGAFGGDEFTAQVAVFDGGGIIVPSYADTVTARLSDGSGDQLLGTTTIEFVQGIAYFTDLALRAEGARSIEFASSTWIASLGFVVSIGPAAKLVVLVQPTDYFAYKQFLTTVVVAVQDRGSNTVLQGFEVKASLSANRQSSALLGVTTRQTISGQASFPGLQVDAVGSGFTLLFQALRLGHNDTAQKLSDTTKPFSLKGRLAGIVVTQFPSGGKSFTPFGRPVIIQAVDEAYNICPWYENLLCTVVLKNKPAGAGITLDSTTDQNMILGAATFTNVKLNMQGSGYRFQFSCSGGYRTVQATSPFFTITNEISRLELMVFPDRSMFQVGNPLVPFPELRVYDDTGNVVSGSIDVVNVRLESADFGSPVLGLNGTTTQTISGGMVRFTDLTIFVLGGPFKLKFILNTYLDVSSALFSLAVIVVLTPDQGCC